MDNSVFYQNLEPFSFLERSAFVYPDKPAVIYKERVYTYSELRDRVNRLAGALKNAGIGRGDRVAFIVPNLPPLLEAHYGPMSIGAALVAINTRLSPREIAYILTTRGRRCSCLTPSSRPLSGKCRTRSPAYRSTCRSWTRSRAPTTSPARSTRSSSPRRRTASTATPSPPRWTSSPSTTPPAPPACQGRAVPRARRVPQRLGEVIETGLNWRSVYLWTLPMFHCNGWCHTWAVTAVGGTHVCLRRVDPAEVYRLIERHGVTNMCGAPTVLTGMYSSPAAEGQDLSGLTIATGGAPPAPQVVRTMEGMGANIIHLYGLTETYGPITLCVPQLAWDGMTPEERAFAKAKQGVPYVHAGTGLRVVDEQMNDVPRDGETMGEVVMRSNGVMSGYLDDPDATARAFAGGWFHSGDLGVWHPDGQIELKDRAKDVIISGGENISSQEVEKVIMEHPGVLEVSVVAVPDDRWGETPKAFITLREGATPTADEIIAFCRDRIAHFKAPRHVEFGDLPKTATGKIQKYVLREREWAGRESRVQGAQR